MVPIKLASATCDSSCSVSIKVATAHRFFCHFFPQELQYSQEGDMPSQHPPDVGYYSDLSKDISQEQSRHSASNGSNPPQSLLIYNWEKSVSAKKNHRKHKRVPRCYPGDHVQHQKEQFSAALTTPQMSGPSEDRDHAVSKRMTAAGNYCYVIQLKWLPACNHNHVCIPLSPTTCIVTPRITYYINNNN